MQQYRGFYFDGGDHIIGAESIEAEDDDHTIEIARSVEHAGRKEPWQRSRLIKAFEL